MAVFPDRIVLKNSSDSQAAIISEIGTGGDSAITQGEIVLGLTPGETRIYTKDANGLIVSLGGADVAPLYLGDLVDVDLVTQAPLVGQALVWDGEYWVPGAGGGGGSGTGGLVFWGGGDFTTGDSDGEAPDGGEFTV